MKRDPDVPDRESAGNQRHEALALIAAQITRAERELGAGQEEDDAQDTRWKKPQQCANRPAEEDRGQQQDCTQDHDRSASAGAKLHVTGHAARAIAHGQSAVRAAPR